MLPVLIGLALKALASTAITEVAPEIIKAIGGSKAGEAAEKVISIAKAVTGIDDPKDAVDAISKDPALALELQKRLADERQYFAELEFRREKLYVEDTQDARKAHAADRGVFWLGVTILGIYAIILAMVLYGAYWMLVKGNMKEMDAGLVAAVFSLVGAIIGYIASDAKQVVGYYFGSSRGSSDKTQAMADAVKRLGTV